VIVERSDFPLLRRADKPDLLWAGTVLLYEAVLDENKADSAAARAVQRKSDKRQRQALGKRVGKWGGSWSLPSNSTVSVASVALSEGEVASRSQNAVRQRYAEWIRIVSPI